MSSDETALRLRGWTKFVLGAAILTTLGATSVLVLRVAASEHAEPMTGAEILAIGGTFLLPWFAFAMLSLGNIASGSIGTALYGINTWIGAAINIAVGVSPWISIIPLALGVILCIGSVKIWSAAEAVWRAESKLSIE